MKRIISIFLAVIMILSLSSCAYVEELVKGYLPDMPEPENNEDPIPKDEEPAVTEAGTQGEAFSFDVSIDIDSKSVVPYLDNSLLRTNSYYKPEDITEIVFLSTLDNAPESAWDFSLNKDGGVKAWRSGNTLVVAGEGKIILESNCTYLFGERKNNVETGFINCKTVNFNNSVDTSKVTNMKYMFWCCGKLTSLKLDGIDTSNVTDMSGMFAACHSLTTVDSGKLNTAKVTNFNAMFSGCKSLQGINVSTWDTSKVKSVNCMFYDCEKLMSVDISKWNTAKLSDWAGMFWNCKSAIGLNLSSVDTSAATDMHCMFYGCEKLGTLTLSHFNTAKVTDMHYMFNNCKSLKALDLSTWNTSNVTNMKGMFNGCEQITDFDIDNFDVSKVTDMDYMFCGCTGMKKLNLTSTGSANTNYMFGNTDYSGKTLEQVKKALNGSSGSSSSKSKLYIKSISSKNGKVSLEWSSGKGATKYKVYYASSKSNKYNDAGDTTKTSLSIDGLKVGTEYKFRVKAYVNGDWTDLSDCEYESIKVSGSSSSSSSNKSDKRAKIEIVFSENLYGDFQIGVRYDNNKEYAHYFQASMVGNISIVIPYDEALKIKSVKVDIIATVNDNARKNIQAYRDLGIVSGTLGNYSWTATDEYFNGYPITTDPYVVSADIIFY